MLYCDIMSKISNRDSRSPAPHPSQGEVDLTETIDEAEDSREEHGYEGDETQIVDAGDSVSESTDDLSLDELLQQHVNLAQDAHWSLLRLLRLDVDEHDYQEFKSSEWIARDEDLHSDFLNALSKQVSAFSNGGGGSLIIGVTDAGTIDQGVLTTLKGGTREWLEDIVNHSVSPRLKSFNVFEVALDSTPPGDPRPRAVYIIELPQSGEAPHQARDHRYYLRVAGKSRPMSHVHLEDILRRNNRPRVELARLGPYGEPEFIFDSPSGPKVYVMLRAFLHNHGRVMARHVGAELTLPRAFVSREVRNRMEGLDGVHYTQRPGEVSFFRHHPTPLFPTQESYALCVWVSVTPDNLNALKSDVEVSWSVYADDALPLQGGVPLISFSPIRQAVEWIERFLS